MEQQVEQSKLEKASKTILLLTFYPDVKGQRSCNVHIEHIDKAGCLLGTWFCHCEADVSECLWQLSVVNMFIESCEIRVSLNLDGGTGQ